MIASSRSLKPILFSAICAALLVGTLKVVRIQAANLNDGVVTVVTVEDTDTDTDTYTDTYTGTYTDTDTDTINKSVDSNDDSDSDKIAIELYFESQCPGCRSVLTESFKEAFEAEGFLDMADITLVPYGNAKETGPTAAATTTTTTTTTTGTYSFECQHGETECVYNIIEACALDKITDPILAFSYVDCIERNDESRDPTQDYTAVALKCAAETNTKTNTKTLDNNNIDIDNNIDNIENIDPQTVVNIGRCATTDEGNLLQHKMAAKTRALDPPHVYVPWIVVGGVHDTEAEEAIGTDLLRYVCTHYEGPAANVSPACAGLELELGLVERSSSSSSLPLRLRGTSGGNDNDNDNGEHKKRTTITKCHRDATTEDGDFSTDSEPTELALAEE